MQVRADGDVLLCCHSFGATTFACPHRTIPAFRWLAGAMGGKTRRCSADEPYGIQVQPDAALLAPDGRMA